MHIFNSLQRRILALVAVLILTAVTATPAFAQAETIDAQTNRLGTAAIVRPKVETLRLRVKEEKTATGALRYTPADSSQHQSPRYPMWFYTCYFEGVQVPCSMFAWLWD